MSHIENSDRGITLSKTLAWGILVFLVTTTWYAATTLNSLSNQSQTTASAVEGLQSTLSSERAARNALASRVETLERGEARNDQRLINIEAGVSRMLSWIDRQERGQ